MGFQIKILRKVHSAIESAGDDQRSSPMQIFSQEKCPVPRAEGREDSLVGFSELLETHDRLWIDPNENRVRNFNRRGRHR